MARGKIFRDTAVGNGVVFVNGVQKTFTLEDHWKGDEPPTIGATVEVVLDDEEKVEAIFLLDEKEIVKEKTRHATAFLTANGQSFVQRAISELGMSTIAVIVATVIVFSTFNFMRIDAGISEYRNHGAGTIFKLFSLLNNGEGSGFYGFICWVFLLAPFSKVFVTDKRAWLTLAAPLAYTLLAALVLYFSFKSEAEKLVNPYIKFDFDFSFSLGFYLAIALSLYLTYIGLRKFLDK
ncbi:hypothetical protein [Moraxella marmotae]|uniref:hypothetical protein n=1 Tax=Moraxella marmotae TaxID=3344520 RepID=UPI0035F3FC2B